MKQEKIKFFCQVEIDFFCFYSLVTSTVIEVRKSSTTHHNESKGHRRRSHHLQQRREERESMTFITLPHCIHITKKLGPSFYDNIG